MGHHLLGIRHLHRSDIEKILAVALDFKSRMNAGRSLPRTDKKTVGLLYFEGSTRTRVSFEQAAYYLDFRMINFSGSKGAQDNGESLKDIVMTLKSERLDGLIMRHKSSGAPALVARLFRGPVLNAGDGCHEHPTQALTDAMTVLEIKGKIEGLKIAIVGDIDNSSVARSSAWLFSKLGASVRFVGPRTLMPGYTKKLPGSLYYDLVSGVEDVDAILCMRFQLERLQNGMLISEREYSRFYQIDKNSMSHAAKSCIVLHPGPLHRGLEISDEVADGLQSALQQQRENSIFVRMASLYWIFSGERHEKPKH